jgi:penicillin amidase
VAALRQGTLSPMEQESVRLLRHWNDSMDTDSAAASIWWTFWSDYLWATFGPWWNAAKVPVHLDRGGLEVSANQFSLVQVLEHWTLSDPSNPAFAAPGGQAGTAATVMRAAFATAVTHLHSRLGGSPGSWAWGRLHSRGFPSLTQVKALGYGPRAAGGDPWTVDAAYGMPVATDGPSWRMIVRWTGRSRSGGGAGSGASGGGAVAEGIYPGGQSENPASPWYGNLIADWWNGTYLPMPPAGAAPSGSVRWDLRP